MEGRPATSPVEAVRPAAGPVSSASGPRRSSASDSRLANEAARLVWGRFNRFWEEFGTVTEQAGARFVSADWSGMAEDTSGRMSEYEDQAAAARREVDHVCGDRLNSIVVWTGIKAVFSGLIEASGQRELAETFFNSIARLVFSTEGVNQQIEFVSSDYDGDLKTASGSVVSTEPVTGELDVVLTDLFDAAIPTTAWAGIEADAALAAKRLSEVDDEPITGLELVGSVFYRGMGAYLVGRAWRGDRFTPMALALLRDDRGVYLDAVLTSESELSILFSFARSYFHVVVVEPAALVSFLSELMPRKRIAELYMSIGFHKHGKTELFRALVDHLDTTEDQFAIAEGAEGMVMSVFALAGFEVVFKIIKDTFPPQKQVTPSGVRERYRLVFHHDRVGRLVDAYEFEHLVFPRDRFSAELLTRLATTCSRDVTIGPDAVVLHHVYIERRVTPLDVFLSQADPEASHSAVLDYGQAIKDLTAAGIFPGDMLLKNFGVTRHGRVVFYDYDELKLLEGCSFRRLPVAEHPDDDIADTPWFPVGPNDVFPEEFPSFLGLQGELREAFYDAHRDLFTPDLWQGAQAALASGIRLPVYPYRWAARVGSDLGEPRSG